MTRLKTIDLNADLGEGYDDHLILPFLSSCNIACGGHIGDKESVLNTIRLAIENNVAIGAHPAYPDRLNFGRKSLDIDLDKLLESIHAQVSLVAEICQQESVPLHHIKAHGALYNDMAKNETLAGVIMDQWHAAFPDAAVYVLSDSIAYNKGQQKGIKVQGEVFADRAYTNATELVSRQSSSAVHSERQVIIDQVDNFLDSKIMDHNGQLHSITVDSICLHGDTNGAVVIARDIYNHLKSQNVNITAPQ